MPIWANALRSLTGKKIDEASHRLETNANNVGLLPVFAFSAFGGTGRSYVLRQEIHDGPTGN
jgi:hypothetical protein